MGYEVTGCCNVEWYDHETLARLDANHH
jgi:hypothetical protein